MLPQDLRLPSVDIASLLRRGKRIHEGSVDFIYRKTDKGKRFAFIVSTRVDKRATARNRVKRLLREAVAAHLPHLQDGVDGIFVVRGKTPDAYSTMKDLLFGMFHTAGVIRS